MRYSDRELEQADDYLGMSPEEQMEHYGMQQPRGKAPIDKIKRVSVNLTAQMYCLSEDVEKLEAEIERLKAENEAMWRTLNG